MAAGESKLVKNKYAGREVPEDRMFLWYTHFFHNLFSPSIQALVLIRRAAALWNWHIKGNILISYQNFPKPTVSFRNKSHDTQYKSRLAMLFCRRKLNKHQTGAKSEGDYVICHPNQDTISERRHY